jgi:hypothetical protein
MKAKLIAIIGICLSGYLTCRACDQVEVSREGGKLFVRHNSTRLDEAAARKYFRALSTTNGWATGFVVVTGDTDSDAQRCAGSLRAAGVRKIEVQLIPRKVTNPYE